VEPTHRYRVVYAVAVDLVQRSVTNRWLKDLTTILAELSKEF